MSAAMELSNVTPIRPEAPGARKAAIALILLGQDMARDILRELSDKEVELLLRTASTLKAVPEDEALAILEEYVRAISGQTIVVPQASDFVRAAAEEAFGMDRVRSILGLTRPGPTEPSLVEAVEAGPDAIASVLRKEHPQTTALALSVMDAEKAALVLTKLPASDRADIIRRIAEVRSVTPELLREIGDTLRREMETSLGAATPIDGQSVVVNLLKSMAPNEEEAIFSSLNAENPQLATEIRKKMFVFEDLVMLDGRALQLLLKEIDGRSLTLALKTASTALREHVLSSMSSRAATMILEDLEAMGPVSVSQVESAQDDIVQIALRLASEGKISLR